MEGEALGKKTLLTVSVLVGACVLFVGTASTAAVLVTARLVGDNSSAQANGSAAPEVAPAKGAAAKRTAPSPLL